MTRVRVGVRVRPLNAQEKDSGATNVTKTWGQAIELCVPAKTCNGEATGNGCQSSSGSRKFTFDFCLSSEDPHSESQLTVFEMVGEPILPAMLQGYNSCIFAYGHSGTGKSYTINGTKADVGLLSRLCQTLFDAISLKEKSRTFSVDVSFLELNKERVLDLLQESRALRLREHPHLGPFAEGLRRRRVHSVDDVNMLIHEIKENRVKNTMKESSKSPSGHLLFSLRCHQELEKENRTLVSELHLVDLAGSERLQDETPQSKKQLSNINKSLVTLGIVISTLAESSKRGFSCSDPNRRSSYVPFRSSALTWLLKETLGGNCITCVIATISPSSCCYKDTLSTLRYAERARSIRNRPVINERPSHCLRRVRKEVKTIKEALTLTTEVKVSQMNVIEEQEGLQENNHGSESSEPITRLDLPTQGQPPRIFHHLKPSFKPICHFRSENSLHRLSCSFVLRRAVTYHALLPSRLSTAQIIESDSQLWNSKPLNISSADEVGESFFSASSEPSKVDSNASFQRVANRKPHRLNGRSKSFYNIPVLFDDSKRLCRSDESALTIRSQTVPSPKFMVKLSKKEDVFDSEVPDEEINDTQESVRDRLNSSYSTDSVELSYHQSASKSYQGNFCEHSLLKINESPQKNVPFRLNHYPTSPEPSVFCTDLPELKSSVWPTVTENKKGSPTSSLDSITYVFLDREQRTCTISPSSNCNTEEWVAQSVLQNRNVHHPSSLSTVDSLEVDHADKESRKSPRTLSVDSILLEECLRNVRENANHRVQDVMTVTPLPCESSGISSKSDSSSISVESGSSSTTRRRDSIVIPPTFQLPTVQSRLQTDLIKLMTEVVQLLAIQQRKRTCRCSGKKHKCERSLSRRPETNEQTKVIDNSVSKLKLKEALQNEIKFIRDERIQVRHLLEQTESLPKNVPLNFHVARNEMSLSRLYSSSGGKEDNETEASYSNSGSLESEKSLERGNNWELKKEDPEYLRHGHLHDSGVDCCGETYFQNIDLTSKTEVGILSTSHICLAHQTDEELVIASPAVSEPKSLIQGDGIPFSPFSKWSSKTEQEKDVLLTWMEKELDFLEQVMGPVQYRALPDTFTKATSLRIPIPREFRFNNK